MMVASTNFRFVLLVAVAAVLTSTSAFHLRPTAVSVRGFKSPFPSPSPNSGLQVRQVFHAPVPVLVPHAEKGASASLASSMSSMVVLQPSDNNNKPSSVLLPSLRRRLAVGLGSAAMLALFQGVGSAHASTAAAEAALIAAQSSDSGFIQAFLLIFVSEIGDKTFFIAGLLAAKYGRLVSFTGSIGALAVMTVISTVLGQLFHAVPSSLTQGVPYDDYIAVAAFAYFGIKTLWDTSKLSDGTVTSGIEEEKAEAEELVEEVATAEQRRKSAIALILQTFSLVFAAEIGDRSFLSTIALSAALNPYAVAAGAIAAHASATGVAVIGGAIMSKYLSEKVIGYIGGTLFVVFAITTALGVF